MIFKKICRRKQCRRHFETEVRSQAYCVSACRKLHYASRLKRRKTYTKATVELRLAARSRRLAATLADFYGIPKVCVGCASTTKKLETHHKSGEYFDNSKSNLERRCVLCHNKLRSKS